MYSYVSETDDSTTVNFSAYGRFLPVAGNQLLTVGAKYLRIFRTNPYALTPPVHEGDEWKQSIRLECVSSTRLLSPPLSVATAKIPALSSCDCILLAFDDAKLSIVSINETDRSLQTISLHSFEEEFLREGFTKNFPAPIVRSDPSNRCAGMLIYGKHLTMFPFCDAHGQVRSFSVPLATIDNRLCNVVDMVFLDGYYEPTILFLYEPFQTTAGRASIRFDTMCIMGVSVNLNDQHCAVVWQMSSLPMDINRLIAIPKPIGGAVLLGSNEIVYLNQAVPPSGIALNSCYDAYTKFPLKDSKHLSLTLDDCAADVVGPGKVLIGDVDGRLFLLRLITDGANSVKSLDLRFACESSIPYTITACARGYVFIGSRLGDSQLFKYNMSDSDEACGDVGMNAKKARINDANGDDDEDFELYGEEAVVSADQGQSEIEFTMTFEEIDRLKNIGPVKSLCPGAAYGISPELIARGRTDPVFDCVTSTGHGKDGSICILQRTVRPQVITSTSLEGQQLWAVGRHEDDSHKYLLVSRTRSTLILELGAEMVELEEPIFITAEPTVAAGELADGGMAVQVTSMSIALVADDQQLQLVQLDSNFPVVAASIVDPFVALLTQNGRMLLYQLVTHPHIQLKELKLPSYLSLTTTSTTTAISALCVYRDMSGLMMCSTGMEASTSTAKHRSQQEERKEPSSAADAEDALLYGDDAEDLMLYGGTSTKTKHDTTDFSRKRKRIREVTAAYGGEESDAIDPNSVEPTYWLVTVRECGRLAIHSLPDLTLCYQVKKLSNLNEFHSDFDGEDDEKVKDKRDVPTTSDTTSSEANAESNARPEERVVEILLTGMGFNQGRPVLFAVLDDTVVAYELNHCHNATLERLCIGFRRLPFTKCIRSTPYLSLDTRKVELQISKESERQRVILHAFERISSVMNGVFIAGACPVFALMGAWGGMQAHNFTIDGAIRSFTTFNNQSAMNGFVYLTDARQDLRVARLNNDFDYELPIPTRKVPVNATVHAVRFMSHEGVYAVTTSTSVRTNKIWVVVSDDKQVEAHEKSDSFVLPTIQQYQLHLYSPQDWAPVPNTSISFEEMEVVTATEEVALRSESTASGLQSYLAVGTINNYGEEVLVRGRIILAEVIDVVPEPGMPTSKHKIKVVYDKEQKGPVTALCCLNGLLMSGMAQKIFIWAFRDGDLQGISFLDMHFYVHQLVTLRTIALACDMHESLALIRFQEPYKALSIASRDDRSLKEAPMAAQFIVDNNYLGFVMSDERGNLNVFKFLPETKEANGGERLVLRAIVNIGTNINAWIRIKGHTSLLGVKRDAKTVAQQQTTVFASLDGSLGFVRPINEKVYRRLHFLQQFMNGAVPQAAGLNPKGARSVRPPRPLVNAANHRNVVDGDVVEQFLHLSTADKQDLARRLGASRYHIMDDLIQMERLAQYF